MPFFITSNKKIFKIHQKIMFLESMIQYHRIQIKKEKEEHQKELKRLFQKILYLETDVTYLKMYLNVQQMSS